MIALSLRRDRVARAPAYLRTARLLRVSLCLAATLSASPPLRAQQQVASVFNAQFLDVGGDQQSADLSLFAFANSVLPGLYTVDVIRNGVALGQERLTFRPLAGVRDAAPCLTSAMFDRWGVNTAAFSGLAAGGAGCVDIAEVIPQAAVSYDAARQRLLLDVPQAALKRAARGAISPERWDAGITAGVLNYELRAARQDLRRDEPGADEDEGGAYRRGPRDTAFGSLRGGFNLGAWRLRHFSTLQHGLGGQGRWQAISTYAQRDLASIRGRLLIGDGNTTGEFFDSMHFRGVQVRSDDAMLPDSLQGYAPTIRGVAQTHARVELRQNGFLMYTTYVAPGPFVLDDLYPTASSGDIEVTVIEADGRKTSHTQAYAAVPTLLREDAWRYEFTAGQYRDGYGRGTRGSRPMFVMGTLARGLGHEITAVGGLIAANRYQSLLAGLGTNLRHFGAISFDLTQARSRDARGRALSGQSLRFLYAKSFDTTGTRFRVAGYRYSSSGFRTFLESAQGQTAASGLPLRGRRNELRVEVAQQLGDAGSVYLSARQQSYWHTAGVDRLLQTGYSGHWRKLGYAVFYNLNSNLHGRCERQLMLTLSIPLGGISAQYSLTRGTDGGLTHQATLSGYAYDDYRLSYALTATRSARAGTGGSASLSYLAPIARFDLSRSQTRGGGRTAVSMAGGAVLHAGGITLSQPLGETVALVRVPRAGNVGFESRSGIHTDAAGNAVIPDLSPYRDNRLALRTADLGDDVDVEHAALDLVPTRGAVVLAQFKTSVGIRLMMTLTDRKGAPLPFGSRIENGAGAEVGIVGPDGQAFITGAAAADLLTVKWGRGVTQQCQVRYALPRDAAPAPIRETTGHCG